jgi:prepilin-type N-terminal cleavage/methylation domain-containing protein
LGSRITDCLPKPIRAGASGYTLVELIVVIALIGIMLSFSLPKFRDSFLTDNSKKVSRWFMIKVRSLKHEALKNRKLYILHLDLGEDRMWVSHEGMSEEEQAAASRSGYDLPENIEVIDVEYPDGEKISFGRADIRFYKDGYSDKVLIHLEDGDNNRTSLLIEPFLSKVKYYEEYVGFDH